MAAVFTQPLTEINNRNASLGSKEGRCLGLITLLPSCADCLDIWESHPPGTFRAGPGLYRGLLDFYLSPNPFSGASLRNMTLHFPHLKVAEFTFGKDLRTGDHRGGTVRATS